MATLVQFKASTAGNAIPSTGATVTFDAPVTAGNIVVAAVAIGAAEASCAASDAVNGAYTSDAFNGGGGNSRAAAILSKVATIGGFSIVTVTPATTGNGQIVIYEISGATLTGVQSGTALNGAVTSQVSSTVTLSATGFAVCAAQAGSNLNWTVGAGYTNTSTTTANSRVHQYLLGTINDAGPFTYASGTASSACMAVYANAAVSPTLTPGVGAAVLASTTGGVGLGILLPDEL